MAQGAEAVEARHHPRAAVLDGGVVQRDPDGEVLLRLGERVAVVLVPWEAARLLGLLVDGLVPVEAHVRPHQVGAQRAEGREGGEAAQPIRPLHEVGAEGDGAGLGDREALVVVRVEEGLDLGVVPVDLRAVTSARRLAGTRSGTTTNPSRSNCATCSADSAANVARSSLVLPLEPLVPRMVDQRSAVDSHRAAR